MGKSTTGNKLLGLNGDGSISCGDASATRFTWPMPECCCGESAKEGHFPVGAGALSETTMPRLISNENAMRRVLDTPGFSQTGSELPTIQANREVIRQIVYIQSQYMLKFRYVVYFLPYQGLPPRGDHVLIDEIAILHHYFGESIWKCLVFVITAPPEYQDAFSSSVGEGKWQASVQLVVTEALHSVWMKYNCNKSGFGSPKLIYLSEEETYVDTISKICDHEACTEKVGGLQLRSDQCTKCSARIELNCELNGEVAMGIPITATLKDGTTTSKCHPQCTKYVRKLWQRFCIACRSIKYKETEGCCKVGSLHDGIEVNHETRLSIERLLI